MRNPVWSLALIVPLATSAHAAAPRHADAPTLQGWLGAPIGPYRAVLQRPAWIRHVEAADAALVSADAPGALRAMRAAIEAAPRRTPACGGLAALHLLEGRLADVVEGTGSHEAARAARSVCIDAQVEDPSQAALASYLQAVLDLEALIRAPASEIPPVLRTTAGQDELRRQMTSRAEGWTAPQAAQVGALMDELLAVHAPPVDRCDDAQGDRRASAQAAAADAHAGAGRPDRAARLRAASVRVDGAIDEDRMRSWLDTIASADPVTDRAIVDGFIGAATSPPLYDASLEARWCDVTGAAADRIAAWGRADTSLLELAVAASTRCPDPQAWSAREGAVVDAAREQGADRLMSLLLASAAPSAIAAFGGDATARDRLRHLVSIVDGLLPGLKRSEDERVAAALLLVARELGAGWAGDETSDLQGALLRARLEVDGLGGARSGLAREAPALRLATYLISAAHHDLADRDEAATQALDALAQAAPAEVRAWLRGHGEERHAPTLLGLLTAVRAVLGTQIEEPFDALRAASQPDEAERGWWRVGFDLARIALWDVAALRRDDQAARYASQADAHLAASVPVWLDSFGLTGGSWELLRLLPGAHHAAWSVATSDASEPPEVRAEAMRPVADLLAAGLDALPAPIREASPAEIGLLAALRDVAMGVAETGLDALVGDPDAQRGLAESLVRRSAPHPPPVRTIARAALGLALASSSPEESDGWLDAMASDAGHPALVDMEWVFSALRASALHRRDGPAADVVAGFQSALAAADEAGTCERPHPVQSLLPALAAAHTTAGDLGGATDALQRYLSLAGDAEGSDAIVRCRMVSRLAGVKAELGIDQSLHGLALARPDEGRLQLQLGYETDAVDGQHAVCSVVPPQGARYDRLAEAWLQLASVRLAAGDARGAGVAFERALPELYKAGDPPMSGGVTPPQRVDLRVVAWSVPIALASGHTAVAEELTRIVHQLRATQDTSWEDILVTTPPDALAPAVDPALGGLMKTWFRGLDPRALAELHKQALRASLTADAADAVVRYAAERLGGEAPAVASRTPTTPVFRTLRSAESPPPSSPQRALAAAEALAELGFFRRATELLVAAAGPLPDDDAIALLEAGRGLIAPTEAPLRAFELFATAAQRRPELRESVAWSQVVLDASPPLDGAFQPPAAAAEFLFAGRTLALAGRLDDATALFGRAADNALQAYGDRGPQGLPARVHGVFGAAARGSAPAARADAAALLRWIDAEPEAFSAELAAAVGLLVDRCGAPASCRQTGELLLGQLLQ